MAPDWDTGRQAQNWTNFGLNRSVCFQLRVQEEPIGRANKQLALLETQNVFSLSERLFELIIAAKAKSRETRLTGSLPSRG